MRLQWGDPGCNEAIVTLDGVQQAWVTAASEEGGWVDVIQRDDQNRLKRNGRESVTERLTGEVRIYWPSDSRWVRDGDMARRREVPA